MRPCKHDQTLGWVLLVNFFSLFSVADHPGRHFPNGGPLPLLVVASCVYAVFGPCPLTQLRDRTTSLQKEEEGYWESFSLLFYFYTECFLSIYSSQDWHIGNAWPRELLRV
ncbi:hypothetical protein CEXT_751721 [Caerostris extrusa]|uniref:Uncharacterized protein n=1 Tax=Caerostris extrusa TaxID=172846 RepID=A0AAV4NSJ6_CAEEX|nr:hypothetical protein CEXT_751721 [Caerostris extrusa]